VLGGERGLGGVLYCCDELADWCGGCACATRRRPVGLRPSLRRFSSPDCGVCASCSTLSVVCTRFLCVRPGQLRCSWVCHVIRRFICATPRVPRRTNWKDQHRPAAVSLFLSFLSRRESETDATLLAMVHHGPLLKFFSFLCEAMLESHACQ